MRDSRSLNRPSAAAKNSGPITRRTSTSSGTSTLTGERRVICAIRRINSREASTIPTLMAITISNSTVSDMQISITMMSSFGARRSRFTTLCASLMFQATISSRAAMAESGSQESSGARISRASITSREWITAETGDVAPARTLAAERAMAAVAVIPPKNGAMRFPNP